MHRVAAAAAAGSASAPNLPNVGVAANITLDQQNTWKALMDMQQQMISFQTGLMRVLETATIASSSRQRCSRCSSSFWKTVRIALNPPRCQASDLDTVQRGSIQSKSCTMKHSIL